MTPEMDQKIVDLLTEIRDMMAEQRDEARTGPKMETVTIDLRGPEQLSVKAA
jgi:hypothetical protein